MQQKQQGESNKQPKIIQRTSPKERRSNSSTRRNNAFLTKADQSFLMDHMKKLELKHCQILSNEMSKIMEKEFSKLIIETEQYCRTTRKSNLGIQTQAAPKTKIIRGLGKLSSILLKKILNSKVIAFNLIKKQSKMIINKNKSATFRRRFIEDDFESSGDVEASGCFISKKSSSGQKTPIKITYNCYKMKMRDLKKDLKGYFILNLDDKTHTTKVFEGDTSEFIIQNGVDSQQPTHR